LSHLGPEFPSLLGGIIGLFIIIFSIKFRFLLPETELHHQKDRVNINSFIIAFLPYIGLSLLLILGRIVFKTIHFNFPLWDGLSRKFYLFQPGMAFFTMPLILLIFHKRKYKWEKLGISLQRALQAVPKPAIAILFIAAISQNLVLSNQFFLSPLLPLLPKELADFLVPFFGALGSFAAGSATVSNLLFGQEINL
jgi:lactate permease